MQNAGYYIEKNREIVDALIANYAFFSIFHCVREQIPAKVDEVHSLLIENDFRINGRGLLQLVILFCVQHDMKKSPQVIMKVYDTLRALKGDCDMPYFTVFTPTFNRAYILPQLYHSLCEQSCKDFEWLIVDDGSSDQTGELIARWKERENGFVIRCYQIPNGGKPRAINFGITKASGKFFFMVDSDDHLTVDAIEKMRVWCKEIETAPEVIGVGAARGYPDGRYLKGTPPRTNQHGYVDATNLERSKYDLDADMCEAYKTSMFRQFPMAEWPGENSLRNKLR